MMIKSRFFHQSIILLCLSAAMPLSLGQTQVMSLEAQEAADAPVETTPAPAIAPVPTNLPAQGITLPAANSPTPVTPAVPASAPEKPQAPHVLNTRLVLKLKERRVYVYQQERVLAAFPVAIGRKGWETPTGNFKVMQMVKNPKWQHPWNGKVFPPGPNSPLGERWIGFWTDGKNSIGFHGTPNEKLIGQAVSHGCVRMRNKDVKELFERVQIGTPVVVQP
jgi:lipoprotein-anchoring transpeptidase ErfK/SrfK